MRNTNYSKTVATVLSFTVLVLPVIVYGAGLIPCGFDTDGDGTVKNTATLKEECEFSDLTKLANTIISFLMYDVAVPLAALGIMWAGGKLVMSQNKEGAWTEAKESFGNIGMGFLIMLGAFVLLKLVLFTFLSTEQIAFMDFMLDLTD